MTPEKRDEEMERILTLTEGRVGYVHVCMGEDSRDAINECWRKAKAWDELREYGLKNDCYLLVVEMDKAFPPEPTTPLGKLEAWLDNDYPGRKIDLHTLRAKIAELRKEEGKA